MGNPQFSSVSANTNYETNSSRPGLSREQSIDAFPNIDCACELSRRASRSVTQLYDLVLTPAHLKASQFILLRAIAENGEIAQCQLSKNLCVAVVTLTRRLGIMRRAGWVQLRLGNGRRERLYSLTDTGRAQLIQAQPYWERAQQRLREQLGAIGWSQMYDCLNYLAASATLSLAARRKNVSSLDKSLSQS